MAIEGTMFALVIVSYFYIRGRSMQWPLSGVTPTARIAESIGLGLLVASVPAMALARRAARREQLRPTRTWLIVSTALGLAFLACRAIAFARMGFRWDANAYGSVVWTATGLHTVHGVAGTLENAVFAVLLFKGPVEKKLLADIDVNGLYWYFVIAVWAPMYALIYLESVLLGP
jgi:heme/copper-type cytochrome/quinol oxidase subunit 3